MTDEAILAALTEVFGEVFGEPIALRPEMTADDVEGWDSSRMIELIVAAEAHFKVKFTTREIDAMGSVGDFVATIARKSAGPAAR